MDSRKRTVLITGCSDGGMGAALAKEFHGAGLHVIATARDTSRMSGLASIGIETLPLDIQSESSIQACFAKVTDLDLLINNAGAMYTMPVSDLSIQRAKELFDINVWGNVAVTQAFLPLLLKSSKPMVVNHTSAGVGMVIPFQSAYNASKAAMSIMSNAMRLELEAFGITIIELRTGGVKSNLAKNVQAQQPRLPAGSIYTPAKDLAERALMYEWFEGMGISAEQWAKEVVADLLKKNPPAVIWRGESAWGAWIGSFLPIAWFDGMLKKMVGLDKVEDAIRKR